MNKEKMYKVTCLLLAAIIFFLGILQINNIRVFQYQNEIEQLRTKADNLAVTLSQINGLYSVDSPIISQINNVLSANGYSNLMRVVPTTPAELPPRQQESVKE